MIFNQHLRAADESVEIRFNSNGDSACFFVKDGEVIMYDSLHSLNRHQYFGENVLSREYMSEEQYEWVCELEVYEFYAIKEAIDKKAIDDARQLECDAAREVLKKNGYFVDRLWHVDDVKASFNDVKVGLAFDDAKAQEILGEVLANGWLTESTNELIQEACNKVK